MLLNNPYINRIRASGGASATDSRNLDLSQHVPTNSVRLLSNNSHNLTYLPYSVVAGSAKNKRLSVSSHKKEDILHPDVRQLQSKSFMSIIGNSNISLTNETKEVIYKSPVPKIIKPQ